MESHAMHGHSVILRNARPEEFDAVADLLRLAYAEYRRTFPLSVWDRYIEQVADVWSRLEQSELIVAEQNGQLLGTVAFYPDASRSSEETWPAEWASIRRLAVHPDARRKGLGHALTSECVRRARARAKAAIALHTREPNAAARALYEQMGFVRAPDHDIHPAPAITALAYCLYLGSEARIPS
jgi:ribosomal protein S18 acetylase RimI-like enzyme